MQQATQQQNKLYVGNLNFDATEDQVREVFSVHGDVQEVKIVMDRFSGKSRGFAFVRFGTAEAAGAAKEALQSQAFQGKTLVIDFARTEQREPRPAGDRRERPAGNFGAPRREYGGNDRGNDRNERGNDRGGYRGGNDRGNDRGDRYSR
jgi:RNA recognition motif-containing protein